MLNALQGEVVDLALVFGSVDHLGLPSFAGQLQATLPEAILIGCSTAGEITADGVSDGLCTVTAVRFEKTTLIQGSVQLQGMEDSYDAGRRLGQQLSAADLSAIVVFGPGVRINGSALVDGVASVVGNDIPITGGLAGDGGAFKETLTLGQEGICNDRIVGLGFRGDALHFGHGTFGGWEPFGPARKVTRAEGNILFELDGEPALEIYRRYLGSYAKDLPASGLLFPFAMLGEDHSTVGVIRTILGIDEAAGALVLAGEIDPNGYLRLMHSSTDKLVSGADTAARAAASMFQATGDSLAILVSCVGRKLVMGNRVDEEVEAVANVFNNCAAITGFYSYGEISPFAPGASCRLHNQTMTITCFSEC